MKKGKYPINQKDFNQLKEMGYEVRQMSPWHYRINQFDDTDVQMDIWPTSRKYCILENGHMNSSRVYENLIDLVETQLDIYNRLNK